MFRPMPIEPPITKDNFFWGGTYGRMYGRTEEGGRLTCHDLAGSSGGTRNSQNFVLSPKCEF